MLLRKQRSAAVRRLAKKNLKADAPKAGAKAGAKGAAKKK
jgi:hypothetical protein